LPIDGFAFIIPMSTPKSKIRGANKRGHSSLIEPKGEHRFSGGDRIKERRLWDRRRNSKRKPEMHDDEWRYTTGARSAVYGEMRQEVSDPEIICWDHPRNYLVLWEYLLAFFHYLQASNGQKIA
jgi:hypothetical protein